VYRDPLDCLIAELNESVPVPAEPCVILILTVWPGWIFEALICVFAPLASVRVKKLLVAKSKEAVVEAIEEDITFPLNDPVTITVWFNGFTKEAVVANDAVPNKEPVIPFVTSSEPVIITDAVLPFILILSVPAALSTKSPEPPCAVDVLITASFVPVVFAARFITASPAAVEVIFKVEVVFCIVRSPDSVPPVRGRYKGADEAVVANEAVPNNEPVIEGAIREPVTVNPSVILAEPVIFKEPVTVVLPFKFVVPATLNNPNPVVLPMLTFVPLS